MRLAIRPWEGGKTLIRAHSGDCAHASVSHRPAHRFAWEPERVNTRSMVSVVLCWQDTEDGQPSQNIRGSSPTIYCRLCPTAFPIASMVVGATRCLFQ